jgi:hypothetical protein
MTLISSSLARCEPGKREQFRAIALEAMKLFERHGAHQVRLLEALTAGENVGLYVLTNEFPSSEAYGEFYDHLQADAEFEALMNRVYSGDSPATVISRSLAVEIPLEQQTPKTRGTYVEVYVCQPLPGRFDAACDFATRAFTWLGEHGATNCRLTQLNSAGQRTGALVATWEYGTMRERGIAEDAWISDPAGRELAEEMFGASAPFTTLSNGIYRDAHM